MSTIRLINLGRVLYAEFREMCRRDGLSETTSLRLSPRLNRDLFVTSQPMMKWRSQIRCKTNTSS